MKTYKFEVIVYEGNDEFWEQLRHNNRSGCDEIIDMLQEVIGVIDQFDTKIKLIEFTDKE